VSVAPANRRTTGPAARFAIAAAGLYRIYLHRPGCAGRHPIRLKGTDTITKGDSPVADMAEHRKNAHLQFSLANQAATAAEAATKDPALKNLSKAITYYNSATGEILIGLIERIERLHHKIDRFEKKLG